MISSVLMSNPFGACVGVAVGSGVSVAVGAVLFFSAVAVVWFGVEDCVLVAPLNAPPMPRNKINMAIFRIVGGIYFQFRSFAMFQKGGKTTAPARIYKNPAKGLVNKRVNPVKKHKMAKNQPMIVAADVLFFFVVFSSSSCSGILLLCLT